jgi:NAD(P)-dependent dehydrogenase (short-subunit alcohol dehydrogenase family)
LHPELGEKEREKGDYAEVDGSNVGRTMSAKSRAEPMPTPPPWSGKLHGQVALVTGSSRGVGKGIALVLGEAGATVYVTGRTVEGKLSNQGVSGSIQETAREVTARGGVGIPVRVDHSRDQETKRLIERIWAREHRLDILVNNAFGGEDGSRPIITYDEVPFWKHDFDEWWYRMFTAYLRSDMATTFYALPLMLRKPGGLVINTLWWNRGRYLCDLFFDLASCAVDRMSYGLTLETRSKGVTVLGVSPGWTRTEHMSHLPPRVLKRLPSPEYVGRAVVHLALDPRVRKKSGKTFEVGALAKEYGFTNVDGRVIDYHEDIRRRPIPGWPPD